MENFSVTAGDDARHTAEIGVELGERGLDAEGLNFMCVHRDSGMKWWENDEIF